MQLETCATFVKIMSRRPMKKSRRGAKKIRERRKTAFVEGKSCDRCRRINKIETGGLCLGSFRGLFITPGIYLVVGAHRPAMLASNENL